MNLNVRVFVNERMVAVEAGMSVLDAIRAADPALAARVEAGEAAITDGRAVPLAGETPVTAGTIVRVVVSARRRDVGSDAHA